MKKSIIMTVILSFSVLFSIGASSLSAEAKMSNTESDNIPYTQQKFSFTASNGETISYYVCLPKGYDDTTDYPLVVYMHGIGGDTDTSGYEYLRTEIFKRGYKAVIIAPIASWSGGQEWIDRTVLVGEGPRKDYNQDELTATKALVAAKELIEQSKNTYHTIRKRTYCVGVSMVFLEDDVVIATVHDVESNVRLFDMLRKMPSADRQHHDVAADVVLFRFLREHLRHFIDVSVAVADEQHTEVGLGFGGGGQKQRGLNMHHCRVHLLLLMQFILI